MQTRVESAILFTLQLVRLIGASLNGLDVFNEQEIRKQMGYGSEWIFFPDGDGMPHFVNLSMPEVVSLPRYAKVNEVEYRFYARGVEDYIILDQAARPVGDVNMVKLISKKLIKMVTHGWMSSADKSVVMGIKDSYLSAREDVVVVGVDWSSVAMDLRYPVVAQETADVGRQVGRFLHAFHKLYDVQGDRLHLIGHSLGAHVMGIAASTSNLTIDRITGLDPARPLFEFPKKPDAFSLDKSDAVFVDVVHSCGGILGVQDSIGHADFYPNSGAAPQPGCESIFFLLEACSHGRSHAYFAESIGNPAGFSACQCLNWSEYLVNKECKQQTFMGDHIDRNASGKYFLITNPKAPYGRNTV